VTKQEDELERVLDEKKHELDRIEDMLDEKERSLKAAVETIQKSLE
jgi:hypothetical protein